MTSSLWRHGYAFKKQRDFAMTSQAAQTLYISLFFDTES